jgi:REP element-mobilizing transposase RayT
MSNYRRSKVPGGTYFFTVNLLERRRRLLVEHIVELRAAFRATHAVRPFEVIAIVVLPDHLHCVWRLPEGDADNANRWAQIKAGVSRRLPRGERRSAPSYDKLRSTAGSMAAHVGDRLLLAAEDRIRGGSRGRRQPAGSFAKTAGWVLLIKAVLPLVLIAFIALVGFNLIKHVAMGLQPVKRAPVMHPASLSVPAASAEQAVY